jgi:uncharacterized phage protein (TIGR02218 family)
VAADAPAGAGRALTLTAPPRTPIAVGDAFTVTVGCDGGFGRCGGGFGNTANFRGFPYLPGDDWVGSYPVVGEVADGRSRHG